MSWKITYPVSHLSALSYNSRYCRLLSMFMIFTLKASKTRPTVCPHPHKVRPEGLLSHFGIALALSEFPLSPWLKAFTYAIKAEDLFVLSMYIWLISGWCIVFRIPLDFFFNNYFIFWKHCQSSIACALQCMMNWKAGSKPTSIF